MRVLIANHDPDITEWLAGLVREALPDAEIASATELDGIAPGADLAVVVLENVRPLGPLEERIPRVLDRLVALGVPVIALSGRAPWVLESARARGIAWVGALPPDYEALRAALRLHGRPS